MDMFVKFLFAIFYNYKDNHDNSNNNVNNLKLIFKSNINGYNWFVCVCVYD